MTMYRLKNWRDKGGSKLDKAKTIIADKNTNLKNLSLLTKIPYQSLVNYRANLSKLDRASWKRISILAQSFDIAEIQDNMTQNDVKELQSKLHSMFNNWRKQYSNDNSSLRIINSIETIITSDPVACFEIFRNMV